MTTQTDAVTWHHSNTPTVQGHRSVMRSNDDSTHLTDGEGDDMYDDWTAELTREQFAALFSADSDASDDDFGGFEPAK